MRRKNNELRPIEASILQAGIALQLRGKPEFHGFSIAKEIQDREGARLLTELGTLYRALSRMEKAGLLRSRWEEPTAMEGRRRPARRLYTVTAIGEDALSNAPPMVPYRPRRLTMGLGAS